MNVRTLRKFVGPNRTGKQQLSFLDRVVRRDLRVQRVEQITPRMRRIVLAGEDLTDGFPFRRFACNDHVKVYFPDPATGHIAAYRETADGGWEPDTPDTAVLRRDYTPRAWDPEAGELALDFVVHDHGVAGVWARDAEAGDALVVMGPRANWLLPEDYRHYLAVGDETALPAISRVLEEAPAGTVVTAVVEVADAGEEQELTPAEDVVADLRWVHRDTAGVGTGHLSALETAVRAVPLPEDLTSLFVFAAGETGAMKPIRRYLRREVGLEKDQVAVDGYWKRGVADHDHHTESFDD